MGVFSTCNVQPGILHRGGEGRRGVAARVVTAGQHDHRDDRQPPPRPSPRARAADCVLLFPAAGGPERFLGAWTRGFGAFGCDIAARQGSSGSGRMPSDATSTLASPMLPALTLLAGLALGALGAWALVRAGAPRSPRRQRHSERRSRDGDHGCCDRARAPRGRRRPCRRSRGEAARDRQGDLRRDPRRIANGVSRPGR